MSLEKAAIAANRFGLGARPGDLKAIAADPQGWLLEQLTPEADLPAPLKGLPTTAAAQRQFPDYIATLGLKGLGGAPRPEVMAAAPGQAPPTVEQAYVRFFGPGYAEAVKARIDTAAASDRPFYERLVRFWGNHFTVSAAKPEIIALAPVFERDVVRPRVCARFEEMLLASCRHPGMLLYLDNALSIGPNSGLAHNPQFLPPYLRERMKGLNENLGREVLELHTLGVRSGYSQADVRSLALMLTGWSVHGPRDAADDRDGFHFIAFGHEPGPQTLLGKRYDQDGEAQADAALRDLARHPATGRRLALKLARHFIADDPPAGAVERIAAAYDASGGDLKAATTALVAAPEAWEPQAEKFKPPEDYVISTLRALGGPPLKGYQLVALLDRMGQRPFWAPGPDGWPDVEANWIGPDPVWKRMEWASALASGYANTGVDPAATAAAALGPRLSRETGQAIRLAESASQGLALFLISPEFQRR
jgi:uncharacterized protein (DUF1800 family)